MKFHKYNTQKGFILFPIIIFIGSIAGLGVLYLLTLSQGTILFSESLRFEARAERMIEVCILETNYFYENHDIEYLSHIEYEDMSCKILSWDFETKKGTVIGKVSGQVFRFEI